LLIYEEVAWHIELDLDNQETCFKGLMQN